MDYADTGELPEDLLRRTPTRHAQETAPARRYLIRRSEKLHGATMLTNWIRMVAVNRLTGHSPGFFAANTLPPNQAVSVKSQKKINETRSQQPPRRHVAAIISRKSRLLLSDCSNTLSQAGKKAASQSHSRSRLLRLMIAATWRRGGCWLRVSLIFSATSPTLPGWAGACRRRRSRVSGPSAGSRRPCESSRQHGRSRRFRCAG